MRTISPESYDVIPSWAFREVVEWECVASLRAMISDDLRRWEIDEISGWLPDPGRVLELGAGDGVQAAALADRSFEVEALEIESDISTWREYQSRAMFPLTLYDGERLPFEAGEFDLVFSSHVLEHVANPVSLLAECRRVLAPGGRMVMIVPSPFWRLWSIPAYYPGRLRELLTLASGEGPPGPPRRIRLSSFFPSTHGEKGNVVSEMIWYSRWRWRGEFHRAGLRVVAEQPIRLFASGEWLTSIGRVGRRRLTRILGATRRMYVVQDQSIP